MMSGGRGMPLSDLPDPLPAGAVLGIVQLDPHRQELLPDLVGAGEVTAIACRPPLRDEPLDRTCGGLEELGRKRQWTPVMRTGHERIADGARLIALGQDVAQCRKIFEPL